MTKQRKWFKRIGLALLALMLALVLAVGGYVLYLQTGYYRIPDGEVLTVENSQTGQLAPGQDYTTVLDGFIVSDNIIATAENIDTNFAYSDHNPVKLTFRLGQAAE